MYRVVKRKDKTIEKLKETIHELEVRLKWHKKNKF
jgi:hypothetical protein